MAKTQSKAKGRGTQVVEKPAPAKRERPSRAKPAASVALEHKQAMRDPGPISAKSARVTAPVGTASSDPILRLDPDLVEEHELANAPVEASIADSLVVYLLELEYKHYEDDSNPVAQLVKRNAQEAATQTANVALVITDYAKYVNDARSGSSNGIIELADGGKLTEELKYYVNQAIYRFTTAVDSRINVTRCVVQLYSLPGIPFII